MMRSAWKASALRRGISLVEVLLALACGVLALLLASSLMVRAGRSGARLEARDLTATVRNALGDPLRWDLLGATSVQITPGGRILSIQGPGGNHRYEIRDRRVLRDGSHLIGLPPCGGEFIRRSDDLLEVRVEPAPGQPVDLAFHVSPPPPGGSQWIRAVTPDIAGAR